MRFCFVSIAVSFFGFDEITASTPNVGSTHAVAASGNSEFLPHAAHLLEDIGGESKAQDERVGTALLGRQEEERVETREHRLGRMLYDAAYCGNITDVTFALNSGANVNHQERDMWTPLMAAVLQGHSEIVQVLLEQ